MPKINTIVKKSVGIVLASLLLTSHVKAADDIVIYPVEQTAVKSTVFSVVVDGQNVFVQKFKDINYIRFAQKGNVRVLINCFRAADKVEISPKQDLLNQQVNGNTISFQLTKAGYHVLTLNSGERLFILSDDWNYHPFAKSRMTNIMDCGVDSTGKTLSTIAIQRAIDKAARQSKILYFPAGIYKTGTLTIPAKANIYFGAGALLKASENRDDFPVDEGKKESDEVHDKEHYTDNGEWMTFSRLILIDNASDVKIWGNGTIDGSGSVLRAQGKPANLIRVRNSKNVLIEGLMLRDPACWNTHILQSEDVVVRNVKVINDRSVANTDGIDPDASKNVLIDHCFAYCSDDNIAIKTTNNSGLLQNCEKVRVSNCVFLTKKSALKLGTETKGALMQDISFQNNYVVEADRGLVLYCYDGATFQNISFVDNYFEKGYADSQRKAIHFQIKKRGGEGQIKNILIRDCVFSKDFHSTSEIVGLDAEHAINGIKFQNVTAGGILCTSIQDLNLKTNQYVQNISFEK